MEYEKNLDYQRHYEQQEKVKNQEKYQIDLKRLVEEKKIASQKRPEPSTEHRRHNPITNPIEYHIENPYILKRLEKYKWNCQRKSHQPIKGLFSSMVYPSILFVH